MADTPAAPEPAVETVPFSLPSEYVPALDRVLGLATEEILIFDRDLRDGGWGSVVRNDMLRALLMQHRKARMQIIVHDTTHIERYLPRLTLLLRDLSHKVSIMRTIEDGRNAWDAFVLVDNRHVVHKFHLDSMRGEIALHNPKKASELRARYEDILTFTEPGLNATQLGL